jgi:hypothetical protein
MPRILLEVSSKKGESRQLAETFRQCPECKVVKLSESFSKNKNSWTGLAHYCKDCTSAKQAVKYRERAAAEGRTVREPRQPGPPETKWCPDCDSFRHVTEFARNASREDGRSSYCREHQAARIDESRVRLHGSSRHYHLMHRYGVSAAEIEEQVERQAGLCVICLKVLGDKPHVDHDHATGEVRGVLCFNCNGGLGQFRDDAGLLARAVGYLDGTMLAMLMGDDGAYRISTDGWRPAS